MDENDNMTDRMEYAEKYIQEMNEFNETDQQALVEMNKRLRSELTSAFEGYVSVLAKCDLLRKQKLDLQNNYEAVIERLKSDLAEERKEKYDILQELDQLKISTGVEPKEMKEILLQIKKENLRNLQNNAKESAAKDLCNITIFGIKCIEHFQVSQIQEKEQVLTITNYDDIKVLLIKCIEGISQNKSIIPELSQYNIAQRLCDLFNFTKDKIIQWISIKMLSILCESGIITDFIYRNIDFEAVIVGMNTDKDLELARICFQLTSILGSKHNVFSYIQRMRKYIFECLVDNDIKSNYKIECLELLQLLVSDSEFLKYCYEHQIEDILINLLQKEKDDDIVIGTLLRTFIILHASTIFNDVEISVGYAFKKEKAISFLINLFENRINRSIQS